MKNLSCIYEIRNIKNGKRYIGSTKSLSDRMKIHFLRLDRGDHHCRHLQCSWAKYGAGSFIVSILERVEECRLIEREQFFIDKHMCDWIYNSSLIAGRPSPIDYTDEIRDKLAQRTAEQWKNPNIRAKMLLSMKKTFNSESYKMKCRNKKLSENSKKILSEKARERNSDPEFAEKFKEAMRDRWSNEAWVQSRFDPSFGVSKLNADDVREIRRCYEARELMQIELAVKYGVTKTTINAIIRRRSWKHI